MKIEDLKVDDKLPQGWIILPLPDCVYFQEGPGLRKKQFAEQGIPFLNIRTFEDGFINKSKCRFVDEKEFTNRYEHFLLNENDIVVSSSGTIGKIAVIRKQDLPVMLNTSVIRFRSKYEDYLLQSYLKYYLQSQHFFQQIDSSKTGSAIFNYGPSHLQEMSILVPPLNEQKRIVAKLEKLLAKVNESCDRLSRIPTILKRFRQSVLASACSGRLTADWRKSHPDNPEWKDEILIDIIKTKPRNGFSAKLVDLVDYETKTKIITLTATTSGKFKGEYFKYLDQEIDLDSYVWLNPKDILIQRGNTIEYVGVSAIYEGLPHQFIYPDLMMKIQVREDIADYRFIYYALSNIQTRQYFRDNATGTAGNMPKINQQVVMNTPISLPPLEEQKEIVKRVEALFKKCDLIEQRYLNAKAYTDKLTQSILAKAFRGELVPQDPNDESAEVLLERIREEKTLTEKSSKSKKTSKRKTT
ncbi:restriction endonuclease subunit S [Geminocystis sp. CENA526]|uniref:restriction endonuclease subunit S n=1 Tax=Geminocystis sp. CENA526 TaxID=1355871 RepID=UPI003D6F7163